MGAQNGGGATGGGGVGGGGGNKKKKTRPKKRQKKPVCGWGELLKGPQRRGATNQNGKGHKNQKGRGAARTDTGGTGGKPNNPRPSHGGKMWLLPNNQVGFGEKKKKKRATGHVPHEGCLPFGGFGDNPRGPGGGTQRRGGHRTSKGNQGKKTNGGPHSWGGVKKTIVVAGGVKKIFGQKKPELGG